MIGSQEEKKEGAKGRGAKGGIQHVSLQCHLGDSIDRERSLALPQGW